MKQAFLVTAIMAAFWLANSAGRLDPVVADATVTDTASGSATAAGSPDQQSDSFSPFVKEDGRILLPTDYKSKWSHLGGWAVARKPGQPLHEMHDVYTQPESIVQFKKNGQFPDGAVLVKEVRATAAQGLTAGHATWSKNVKIWFVMVKDRKNRFPENDHWGDGWGWALFEAKDPTRNASAGYDTSCLGCHSPVEDTDWIYTYGYPALQTENKGE